MSKRLDQLLVDRGLARSRERAKELIKSGRVTVNGTNVLKPSAQVSEEDKVEAAEDMSFVGRGALKLEKALDTFGIDVKGRICADIGASTGGFTEVMLRRGASKVYAVDVGHGQLAEVLRQDSRVINMEGCNARELTPDSFQENISFVSMDLSFISITKVIGAVAACAAEGAEFAVLIKPQFEAGRSALNKQGVVNDRRAHVRVLAELIEFFKGTGLCVKGLAFSPVRGGSGNIEYLAYLCKGEELSDDFDIKKLVDGAFSALSNK